MKVTAMTDRDAIEHFGRRGPEIVWLARERIANGKTSYVPKRMDPARCQMLQRRYGPNGVAVHLLVQAWMKAPWRENEGRPNPLDSQVTRVLDWSEALDPTSSPIWKGQLTAAGLQSKDPILRVVWKDAGEVGTEVGSHHARYLAAATAGELAQLSPELELHFFIDMMPWILQGHWPCGWDDPNNRLKVF